MRPPATAVTMHGAQRRQRISSRVPSLRLLLIACAISFFIGRNTVPISISTQFCQKIHDDSTPPPPTLISNRRKGKEKEEFADNSTSWPSLNVTFRDDRIYPISFGLPTNRYLRTNLTTVKLHDFASILPKKRGQEYTHSNEESYYNSYSESLFGITFKKAGWDCLRHYEIIAAGSIPFFLDIDELPENTMYDFPVDFLVKRAMALHGLPSIEAVKHYVEQPMTTDTQDELLIDHDVFNITEYYKLRDAIYKYSTKYLTWSAKARYMMQVARTHYPCIQSEPQRALLISVKDCEYLSCTIWGGFYEEFGTERMSSLLGAKTALFRSLSPAATILYGRGFSYKDTYDDEWDEKKMRLLTEERIKGGYFNVIIYMNGRNSFCSQKEYDEKGASLGIGTHGGSSMLHDYQIRHNPLVITVDGNDVRGCHTLFTKDKYPLQSHLHFIREFNSTYHPGMDTPKRWTGCGAPHLASEGKPCPFCEGKGGIADLDLVVPETGGNTCRSLKWMATTEYVDGSDLCMAIQKKERECCPDQINNNHLLQQHNFAVTNSQSHAIVIFWLHIQKTGTSLFNTIYLHFCPSILVKNPSLATQKKPLMDKQLLKDYPPKEFCNNVTFANMPRPGFHHPYPKDTKIGEKYFYFTMLRDPMERLRSAYSFGKHLSKLKNDSISFDTYLNESHIPDCQLKMILGFNCYDFVDPELLDISVAVNRIQAPHFFFGITDRWEESICLFHHMYGGSTQPFELKNNRKTKRVETPGNINRTFAETILFEEALKIFNMRVEEAGC